MKYVLKPSLEYITLMKIVTTLYNHDDTKKSFSELCVSSFSLYHKSHWLETETIVERKVTKLLLPKVLKEKLICFIRPVRLQISEWGVYLCKCLIKNVRTPNQFYWTQEGILDEKKTTEVIIRDESIDITERYKLACVYCLEDDILQLWEKIPEDSKSYFYSQEDPANIKQCELVVFWTYYIKREMENMIEARMGHICTPYQHGFDLAVEDGNKVAAEYFFKKLTAAEKEHVGYEIVQSLIMGHREYERLYGISKLSISHTLYFLLSKLSEAKQTEIFMYASSFVLLCFLDWPLQVFFMETVNHVWNFLSNNFYHEILDKFIDNLIEDDNKNFHFQELLYEFWEQSPNEFKHYVLSGHDIHRILFVFLKLGDINNIKLAFKDITPEEKKLIIYDDKAQTICKALMTDNKLNLLKYFIKQCLPSKEKVVDFKECFKNGDVWHVNKYSMSDWHQKFLCVLTVVIYELKKRKCEESDGLNAKKCKISINESAQSAE